MAVGSAIRALRLEKNMSQEALAHEAGIDRSYMGGIERGEHNIAIINLLRICGCLDLSASDLMRRAGL
jgi:transcriptional regulator with XRE-family HTH domain